MLSRTAELRGLLPKSLAAPTLIAACCRLSSTALSVLLLAILTRSLGPEEYGRFVLLLSVGTLLGQVFPLGQQALLLKHYRRDAPAAENGILLRTNWAWLLAGTGLLSFAAIPFVFINGYTGLAAALLFAALFALTEYFINYFRVHGQMALALVPRENAWRVIMLLGIPLWAWLEPAVNGRDAFLLATGLLGIPVVVQTICFLRKEGWSWLKAKGRPASQWRRESGYFLGANLLYASSNYLDTIVIGLVIGLPEAAVYFTAFRISKLLEMPKLILSTVGIPRVAAACHTNDIRATQDVLGQMVVLSLLPTLLIGIATILLCRTLLGFFDPTFAGHWQVLVLLVLIAAGIVALGEGEHTMKIAGGERQQLIGFTLLLVGHLALLAILGSFFGLTGITVAYGVHVLARGWFAAHWCRKHLGIDPAISSAWPVTLSWTGSRPKGFV